MLGWSQAKKALPKLHALAMQLPLVRSLSANITAFLKSVGKSFLKPACRVLLADVPINTAVTMSGKTANYIYASRSHKYLYQEHRLWHEIYTERATRLLEPVETWATIEWMKSNLGAKSGQTTADIFFRYLTKDAFYHEKYQAGYKTKSVDVAIILSCDVGFELL